MDEVRDKGGTMLQHLLKESVMDILDIDGFQWINEADTEQSSQFIGC